MNKNQWTFGGRTLVSALLLVGILSIYNFYVRPASASSVVVMASLTATARPNSLTLYSPDSSVIVWDDNSGKIYRYLQNSPYTLVASGTMASVCAGSTGEIAVNTFSQVGNPIIAVGGCGYIAIFDGASMGLINSLNTGIAVCGLNWVSATQLIDVTCGNAIRTYTVQSGVFSGPSSFGSGCGQFDNSITVGGSFLWENCVTNGKIYRQDYPAIANEFSFATTCGCNSLINVQQLSYDSANSLIWHAEAGNIRGYNQATGAVVHTYPTQSGFGNADNVVVFNGILFYSNYLGAFGLNVSDGSANFNSQNFAFIGSQSGVVGRTGLAVLSNGNVINSVEGGTDSKGYVIQTLLSGSSPSGGNGSCGSSHCYGDVNCDLPQNQNILACNIVLNPNSGGFTSTGQMLNQSASNIVCGVGLITCTFNPVTGQYTANGSIKTNGVGYILVVVGMGILISMFWLASGGDLRNIPLFVWFISMIGFIGMMVAFGFIDVTFLLISIIVVVALASAKVIQTLDIGKF